MTLRRASASARRTLPLDLLALRVAQDFLGLEEEGGDNRGPAVEFFQANAGIPPGSPWCAAMVNACAHVACAIRNEPPPLEEVPLQGLVQSYVDWAEEKGWLVEPDEVFPGDLFCLWFASKERYAHIGFVHQPPEDGEYSTVEGNTGDEGEREGYKVGSRIRKVAADTRFIRWVWD